MIQRDTFLSFNPPALSDAERAEVMDTLNSEWVTTGPKTRQFEVELGAYLGAPGIVALNSCTAALHVGLSVLGIGPGDEVIVPALTFCATANVVEHMGARPVLVDVEPGQLTLDPIRVAEAVTPRTRAILPVHYAGHPADLDPLFALCAGRDIAILEDAAHALPTSYRGIRVGSRSSLAAFSFYATKNLSTVEGGALTGDPALVERARTLGHHGMNRDAWKRFDRTGSWYYEVVLPGFKYNLTDIAASIGLQQLKRLEGFQRRRRQLVAAYRDGLGDLEALRLPVAQPWAESSWHLYVVRLDLAQLRIDRNAFIEELKTRNIGTSVHYLPVHMQPYYREKYHYLPADCPVAADAFTRMVSLPLHPGLSDSDLQDVVAAVRDVVARFRA